jgi:predicted GNAT family acetyltransferase
MTEKDPESRDDLLVTDNRDAGQYEITANGEPAGVLQYRRRGDRVVFTHAEVQPRFEGKGVESTLAKHALDDVLAQGKLITPLCPFVVDYLHRHHEYVAHVDPSHQAEFADDAGR